MKPNPYYEFTEDETTELRNLYRSVRHLLPESRANQFTVFLAKRKASLSHRQLFALASQMGEHSLKALPDWIFDKYLYNKE